MDSLPGPMLKAPTMPDDLQSQFDQAYLDITRLERRPDNDTLLRIYALYKQGAEGDVSGARPGFFDFIGTAKYEAWAKLAGMARSEAMQAYVTLVRSLQP